MASILNEELDKEELSPTLVDISLALSALIRGTDFIFDEKLLTKIVWRVFLLYDQKPPDDDEHCDLYLSMLFLLGMINFNFYKTFSSYSTR
jgi:hypothetical protein